MVVLAAEDGVVIVVDDKFGDPGDKDAVCRLRTLFEVRAALVAGVLAADTERGDVGGVDRTVELSGACLKHVGVHADMRGVVDIPELGLVGSVGDELIITLFFGCLRSTAWRGCYLYFTP